MNEHKHAWALRLIADGVPLEEFEARSKDQSIWDRLNDWPISLLKGEKELEIRRKQRTHVVNGFTVVASEQVPPARGTCYYPAMPTVSDFSSAYTWCGCAYDERLLERGLVFLTKEAAIMNAKAMCGIDPSK